MHIAKNGVVITLFSEQYNAKSCKERDNKLVYFFRGKFKLAPTVWKMTLWIIPMDKQHLLSFDSL